MTGTVAKSAGTLAPKEKFFSIEEYFRLEDKSVHKHEYYDGKIILMAGAKLKHNGIASQIIRLTLNFIDENNLDFIVSNSDTKIRIDSQNLVVYPDAVVICKPPKFFEGREDIISNPFLVVEVLSVSTKKYDRTTKFDMYRTIPSFKEYVLIHQDRKRITVWTKQPDGAWLPKDFDGEDSVAILQALDQCPLPLSKVYKNVQ